MCELCCLTAAFAIRFVDNYRRYRRFNNVAEEIVKYKEKVYIISQLGAHM